MNTLKKAFKFISSMRFAIALLVLLAVACSLSSLVTQGQSYAWYAERYGERVAGLILALRLDDAFHSAWFIAITGFLCVNLLLCNVLRLPQLVRRYRREGDAEASLTDQSAAYVSGVRDPQAAFRRLGMPRPAALLTADGRDALFAVKRRAGLWGAWVCHLGILLLILGFGLGQTTQRQYSVYGVPGQSKPIGDTGYAVSFERFDAEYHEDGSIAQYTTDFTVYDLSGERDSVGAVASVNNPATAFGMKFYQNSTGWAANVSVFKDGEPLQSEAVCAGDYLPVSDKPELVVLFNAFYPDYVARAGAMPATASDQPNNPAYLYSVYYQSQLIGMNVLMPGEELTIDEYTVTFTEPTRYTLLQVKADRFTWLALVGGLTTMLGLILALYLQPCRVWAVRETDGGWTLFGQSRRGGALFRQRFNTVARSEDADASG